MSEEILNALIKLFALTSSLSDVTANSKKIIIYTLGTDLSESQISRLLNLYDDSVKEYHHTNIDQLNQIDLNRIYGIASEINDDLTVFQKYAVLFRLMEYIYADEKISTYEKECLEQINKAFKIAPEDLAIITSFTTNAKQYTPQIIEISDAPEASSNTNSFVSNGLIGSIRICHVGNITQLFMRYDGNQAIFINGRSVQPNRTYVFSVGSSIRGEKLSPIYFSDIMAKYIQVPSAQKVIYEANEISYSFNAKKIGLHPFSLNETNGKMLGIMGGSGAGKSTLLNVLNGSTKPTHGQITINGIDLHSGREEIEGVIGYVTQDDLLIEELTVFENLYYSAKLCMAQLEEDQLNDKVISTLHSLGLYEARNLTVGSILDKVISGGQRKRLNIALELIREPSILFVDEPTSGLSSRDSENIMDLLKQLTLKGKLVFAVIHQPSSDIFKLFDRLIILDTGGYPIYYDNPLDSIAYFKKAAHHLNADNISCITCGNVNTEIIFDIIDQKTLNEYGLPTHHRKVAPKEWYAHFKKNEPNHVKNQSLASNELKSSLHAPNRLRQLQIFITRDVLSKLANRQYLLINLLQAPVLAFIISFFIRYSGWNRDGAMPYYYFFNENIPAYIFMAVVVALFIGMTVSAEEIFKDRKLRTREKFLHLSNGSYLFSKILILSAISALQSFLFIFVANTVLEIAEMNFYYWLMMFSTAFFANMVGLNISSSFNSAVTIYITIPFLIIPQLIFSGVLVSFDRLNPAISSRRFVPVIGELMASKWAYEGLIVAQFKKNPLDQRVYEVNEKLSEVNYLKNYWITELESDVQFILFNHTDVNQTEKCARLAGIIKHELSKAQKITYLHKYHSPIDLQNKIIDSTTLVQFQNYLQIQKKELNHIFQKVSLQKDKIIYQLESDSAINKSFKQLKYKYHNESLNKLLKRENFLTKVIHHKNELLQLSDPVYRNARGVRSHFYASRKYLFGNYIDTFWYNLGVLWLMSAILILMLFSNFIKRVFNFWGQVFKLNTPK